MGKGKAVLEALATGGQRGTVLREGAPFLDKMV